LRIFSRRYFCNGGIFSNSYIFRHHRLLSLKEKGRGKARVSKLLRAEPAARFPDGAYRELIETESVCQKQKDGYFPVFI